MSEADQPRLRAVVVGAGIGVQYAQAFQRFPDVEVAAICAAGRERAAPAAARLGIPGVYTDLGEMLERESPDIVAIATPNNLHHKMTLAAARAGAHVLCDKPLAMNAPEALEMLREADDRGLRHIVPFWWRFLPAVQAAHSLLADGSFGEPFFVDVRYLNCGWGDPHGPMRWQFDRSRAGSGALGNVASHALHVLQWLVGDLVEVCGRSAINVKERRWPDGSIAHPDGEDTVALVGALANGAPVSFLASSVAHEVRSSFSLTAHFSKGSISIDAESHWPADARGRLSVMRPGDAAPVPVAVAVDPRDASMTPQEVAYRTIAGELISAIREGRPASPGFDDGVQIQRVIDAVIESERSRGWVEVRPVADSLVSS
jgi:predicted dehydrogenase